MGVRAVVDGNVSAITVRDLEGKEQLVEGIPGLKKVLTAARGELEDREALRLQGDGRLGVRHLIEVMDACRAVGFTKITFVTPTE